MLAAAWGDCRGKRMLTGNLIRVRLESGHIGPSFIATDSRRYLERAQLIIDMTNKAVESGATRGELFRHLEEEVVGCGVDHRLSRGLVKVVMDRCLFDVKSPLEPQQLRARLFSMGPVARRTGPDARPDAAMCFRELARELGCEPTDVERGLFADLKENQVILQSLVQEPLDLIHRYNVSLVQGLLLHATAVEIRLPRAAPGEARLLFRHVKFRQLMHRIRLEGDTCRIILDGPLSLVRLSTRYGMQLAQFFPALLLQSGEWEMEASLRWKRRKRILLLSSQLGLKSHLEPRGVWMSREEEWFQERFRALSSEWVLERGGDLADLAGEAVLVPDFTFRKGNRVAYLEVVGHWRRGYLARRVELLKKHGAPNLLLAVSRNLLGDKGRARLGPLGDRVIPFAKIIPAREVLKLVERVAL